MLNDRPSFRNPVTLLPLILTSETFPLSVAAMKSEKEIFEVFLLLEVPWKRLKSTIKSNPIIIHNTTFLLMFFIYLLHRNLL